jgi:hypothetical protein
LQQIGVNQCNWDVSSKKFGAENHVTMSLFVYLFLNGEGGCSNSFFQMLVLSRSTLFAFIFESIAMHFKIFYFILPHFLRRELFKVFLFACERFNSDVVNCLAGITVDWENRDGIFWALTRSYIGWRCVILKTKFLNSVPYPSPTTHWFWRMFKERCWPSGVEIAYCREKCSSWSQLKWNVGIQLYVGLLVLGELHR